MWWIVNSLYFLVFYKVNPLVIGLAVNVNNSWLHLEMPSSNWRSYGPSLILAPFSKLPFGLVIALCIFWLLGMYFYEKISRTLLSGKWLQIALWTLPFNTYLFWSMKSQQEFVLEWAFLLGAIFFFVEKRTNYFLLFISLVCFMRPGNILLAVFLVGLIKMPLLKKMVFPLFMIVWLSINSIQYGSFSPALQSGETLSFGWNRGYLITLPLADIDAAYSRNQILKDPRITPEESDLNKNKFFAENAFNFIKENPAEAVAIATSKLDSWFFSILRVPNLTNGFITGATGRTITMDTSTFTLANTAGSLVFALWRAFGMIIWFVAMFLLAMRLVAARSNLVRSDFLLLIPIIGFPVAFLTTPETRYQLAHLTVLIPITLHYLSARVNLSSLNEK
jgi:type IV secretory pathway TrbD component